MNIDLKEYINGREDLFTATNVVEMEECLTKFLEWHKAAISVTRCCEELKCEGCKKPLNSGLCGGCCSSLASGMY